MKKIFLLLTFLSLILLLSVIFTIKSSKKVEKNNILNITKTPVIEQARGSFRLISTSNPVVDVGSSVTLNLIADSVDNLITGYDLALTYDASKVKLKEIKNLLEDFDIYNQKKPGELLVTGMLKPTVQIKNPFRNTALIQLTFQTIGVGKAEFKITWEKNSKKESNLISNNSQEVLDLVQGIIINVGKKITLGKDQVIKLEDGVELKLIDATSGGQGCFDCISSAEISVSKDNQKKDFVFRIGGFAGLMINEFSEFNNSYYLSSINTNEIDLIVFKK